MIVWKMTSNFFYFNSDAVENDCGLSDSDLDDKNILNIRRGQR